MAARTASRSSSVPSGGPSSGRATKPACRPSSRACVPGIAVHCGHALLLHPWAFLSPRAGLWRQACGPAPPSELWPLPAGPPIKALSASASSAPFSWAGVDLRSSPASGCRWASSLPAALLCTLGAPVWRLPPAGYTAVLLSSCLVAYEKL